MRSWKRLVQILIFLSLMLMTTNICVAETIDNIKVFMKIHNNGTVEITQIWKDSVEEFGEYNIPIKKMPGMEIQNFTVENERGKLFSFQPNWDHHASAESKMMRNGIYSGNDYWELRWGRDIYGGHQYTIKYTLTNFVRAYKDGDAFMMDVFGGFKDVHQASVSISREQAAEGKSFFDSNTMLWKDGFEGNIGLKNGLIVASTEQPMTRENSMKILARFTKGWLNPSYKENKSFSTLHSEFMEEEIYEEEKSGLDPAVKFLLKVIAVCVVILLLKKTASRWNIPLVNQFRQRGVDYKDIDYNRRVPMDHSIEQNLFALTNGGEYISPQNVLNAYILRLMLANAIEIKKEVKVGAFGETNEKISLAINRNTPIHDESTKELFDLIVSASGVDNVLAAKEMDTWSARNTNKLEYWYRTVDARGEMGFRKRNGYYVQREDTTYGRTRGYRMTDTGRQLIIQALGFKKYLEDFTLLAERETREVELWDEYLVFAGLFGIADKVSAEMGRLYPSFVSNSAINSTGFDIIASLHFSERLSASISKGLIRLDSAGRSLAKTMSDDRSGFFD